MEIGKVAEGWRPALLQGILADGDLEWISIFIDHFAVVTLDCPDLEEIPVAGLTPPGSIVLGRSENLVPTFGVAVGHVNDFPDGDAIPTLGEGVVKLSEIYATIAGVKVQAGNASVACLATQKEGHHAPQRLQCLARQLVARVWEVALAKPNSIDVLGVVNASNASAWRGCRGSASASVSGGVDGRLGIGLDFAWGAEISVILIVLGSLVSRNLIASSSGSVFRQATIHITEDLSHGLLNRVRGLERNCDLGVQVGLRKTRSVSVTSCVEVHKIMRQDQVCDRRHVEIFLSISLPEVEVENDLP